MAPSDDTKAPEENSRKRCVNAAVPTTLPVVQIVSGALQVCEKRSVRCLWRSRHFAGIQKNWHSRVGERVSSLPLCRTGIYRKSDADPCFCVQKVSKMRAVPMNRDCYPVCTGGKSNFCAERKIPALTVTKLLMSRLDMTLPRNGTDREISLTKRQT